MAYENVDVNKARMAVNSCLNSLRHGACDNFLSGLRNSNEWVADSKSTFLTGIDTLANTRYVELKNYLNKCLVALDNIEKYQNLQNQTATYNSQIQGKRTELKNQKERYNKMDDKTTTEAKNTKKKIDTLESDIKSLSSKVSSNSTGMSGIHLDI
ncbi:MAG: hypothetical protein IJH20_02430 [Bacilli bacterium]|nr:hypothetical protein [Bacilli bacterium]